MSTLSRMLNTVGAILGERDTQRLPPNPYRPPIFTRTHWLLVEIDEANAKAADLAARLKAARIAADIATAARLSVELVVVTQQLAQLSIWVREQFDRERAT